MASRQNNQDRDKVLAATDLVALIGEHIQLRQKGREHVGLCPFHDDTTPSLSVVTHKDRPFYNCFACHAHGNAIDFMIEYHKIPFREALETLAQRAGIELTAWTGQDEGGNRRADLLRATEAAARWYHRRLTDEETGAEARKLLAARGIDTAMIERFNLGLAPDEWDALSTRVADLASHAMTGDRQPIPFDAFVDAALLRERKESNGHYDSFRNRLMFPICDEMKNPVAFGARSIDPNDEPKYLNSPETPLFDKSRTLYALHLAKKSISDTRHAIIVEGYTDVIACHKAGIENAVATLGTSLTREHATRLGQLCEKVTLVFDGDAAGQRAADRAIEIFFQCNIDLGICTLPSGQDPDDLLKSEEGVQTFHAAIEQAPDALDHLNREFRAAYKAATGITARQRVITALLDRLARLGFDAATGTRKHLILDVISKETGIPEKELDRMLTAQGRRTPPPAVSRVEPKSTAEMPEGELIPDPSEDTEISTARREAERRVLALLVRDPDLGRHTIPDEDGNRLTVCELFPPTQFIHPDHRALAEILVPEIESGNAPQVDQLIMTLENDSAGALTAELLRFGRDLLENTDLSPEALLANACSDLEKTVRRERHLPGTATPSNSDPGTSLDETLARLRTRGSDMTAIPKVPRPRRPVSIGSNPTRQRRQDS